MCRSAVNDGSCSPWVMCSCSVVRGNQICDTVILNLFDYILQRALISWNDPAFTILNED